MTVDIPMQHSKTPTLCELYLTKQSLLKSAEEQNDHMSNMVSIVKPLNKLTGEGNKSSQLVLLAESDNVANHLIDKVSAEVLRTFGPK